MVVNKILINDKMVWLKIFCILNVAEFGTDRIRIRIKMSRVRNTVKHRDGMGTLEF
jgi:hypothetical protein